MLLGAVAAVLVLLLWPRHQAPLHSRGGEASASVTPCYDIRNIGDMVVVRSPEGQVLVMTSGGAS